MGAFFAQFPTLLHSAVIFGTVIMFGAMGEILTEKGGNLNLGVPGIMYLGAIAGLAATFIYENVYCAGKGIQPNGVICLVLALVCAFAAAALGGLVFAFLTISLRCPTATLSPGPSTAKICPTAGILSRRLPELGQVWAIAAATAR